jgi:signal transduction histidine kinase/sugar phosphate isomerase/epimerase
MKVGFETIIFGSEIEDLGSVLDMIAGLGYEGVEFSQAPDRIFIRQEPEKDDLVSIDAKRLETEMKARNLVFLGMAGGTLEERMDFCGEYKPLYLYIDNDLSEKDIEKAKAKGFTLALHPHIFMKNCRLEDAKKFLAKHTTVKWLPDTAYIFMVGDKFEDALEGVFQKRLLAVHLKDWDEAFGRSFHRYAHGFIELGEGNVDIQKAFEAIEKSGAVEWLIVEQDYTRLSFSESAKKNRKWLSDRGLSKAETETTRNCLKKYNTRRPLPFEPNHKVQEAFMRFVYELSQKRADSLETCYQHKADALKNAVRCTSVSLWACSVARDEVCLLAPSDEHRNKKEIITEEEQAVTVLKSKQVLLSEETDGHRTLTIPIPNQYNPHHIRLIAVIRFSEEWWHRISKYIGFSDVHHPHWYACIRLFVNYLVHGADAFLDDQCTYLTAKIDILAHSHFKSEGGYLDSVAHLIKEHLGCEGVTIFKTDMSHTRLTKGGSTGIRWKDSTRAYYNKKEDAHTSTVKAWIQKEPFLYTDAKKNNSNPISEEIVADTSRCLVLFIPIFDTTGEVIGMIRCRNKSKGSEQKREPIFTDDDAAMVDVVGSALSPYLEMLQHHAQRLQSISRMSHELLMPMATAKNSLKRLERDLGKLGISRDRFKYDWIGHIYGWNKLMTILIRNAQLIGVGVQPIEIEWSKEYFMGNVVGPIVDHMEMLLQKYAIQPSQIYYSQFDEIPAFHMDVIQMHQVLFNLLSNAIKFSFRTGRDKLRIEIDGKRTPEYLLIFVRDNGPGIPEADRERIFEESYRGSNAAKDIAGQGLGLWITKRIIRAHGGTIQVTEPTDALKNTFPWSKWIVEENAPPCSTEFTIRLPSKLVSSPLPKSQDTTI